MSAYIINQFFFYWTGIFSKKASIKQTGIVTVEGF